MRKKLLKNLSKKLNFNINFSDLYQEDKLLEINSKFIEFAHSKNPKITKLINSDSLNSQNIIEIAIILEEFLVSLFNIKKQNDALIANHNNLAIIYQVKKSFIQKVISKEFDKSYPNFNGFDYLTKNKISKNHDIDQIELIIAQKIIDSPQDINLKKYCSWALYHKDGKDFHSDGALFNLANKLDFNNLTSNISNSTINPKERGFDLIDKGFSLNKTLGQANYCIFCHKQNKDSCRTGLGENNNFKINKINNILSGCPLDEKISEMNLLKSNGLSIAALAVATIDNPMIAGTGHRICNDCMKSCIYQKQDPVNIPQIESRILKDVLSLPYGFEIYSLLTRWNPLNFNKNHYHKDNINKKILICGLGPSGYSLAHNLLNKGYHIIAIDGLKIEPLHPEISGVDLMGNKCNFKPIKYIDEIYEPLSKRQITGFGGVAEYGITVRWDKNYLKIIRLLLERRNNFQMFGGIRFGSSITDQIAFNHYNFDHIALCIGAGKPKIIDIENNFAKGIRLASDFLMSLQLTGAFKEELFTNLQIRQPIIVIGAGLTAIDSACEAQSYYFTQIKKFAKKYEILGHDNIWPLLNEEEKIIAQEFLDDYKNIKNKKLIPTKILYRKTIQESPAYRQNHEELIKAFEQSIEFIELKSPKKAILDKFNHIKAIKCHDNEIYECKSLIIAAGTSPNISPVTQDNIDINIKDKFFSTIKSKENYQFIAKKGSNKSISFFGDLHPKFEGSVVKAMASAKIGAKEIINILESIPKKQINFQEFYKKISNDFIAHIHKVEKLSPNIIQIIVKSKLAAKNCKIGHIFRLQNYHYHAKKVKDQIIAMEGIALTAIDIDRKNGLITGIIIEAGGSTNLVKNFKINEPCIFMGPSGKASKIAKNKNVILIGSGRGNQPLAKLAQIYKKNGCKVIFFATFRNNIDIANLVKMQQSCFELILAIENEQPKIIDKTPNTQLFRGKIIDAIKNYFIKNNNINIDLIFTIGNNYLMDQIAKLRHDGDILAFKNAKYAIANLNSPMQCMMKGVCGQCLQKKILKNGKIQYYFSCANPDQNIDEIDFQHLHYRIEQNSLSEKVTKLWIKYLELKSF